MFLRRDLSPAVAVERVFRARAALRDGLAIYLNGDIPWSGPNTCAGRLLGVSQRFLAIWTELAVLTNAPVFLVFCTHLEGGRFALEIEAIGHLRRRGRIRRRRLPQAARSPDRGLTGRRNRPP